MRRSTTARGAGVIGATLLAAIALAACGGGGSSPQASISSSSSGAAAAAAGRGSTGDSGDSGDSGATGLASRRAGLVACLQKAGIKLPDRPAFGATGRIRIGATGATRRIRIGATGATGRRFRFRFGVTGATGASGRGGLGFLGGGAAGALANDPKLAKAVARCAAAAGGFGAGRRAGFFVARNAGQRAAITAYATCMRRHRIDLPEPNFSGRGSVFGTKVNQKTTAFRTANASCAHLLTFLPASGATGATGPPGA
jgi:hypothetical protein